MNNQEQKLPTEQQKLPTEGYKYLTKKLDYLILTQKNKNKFTVKGIFKYMLKTIYSMRAYPILYWLCGIFTMFFTSYYFSHKINSIAPSQHITILQIANFSLSLSTLSFLALWIALLTSLYKIITEEYFYIPTTFEKFKKNEVPNEILLIIDLTNKLVTGFVTWEELKIFEKRLEYQIKCREKKHRQFLSSIPIFIILCFMLIRLVTGLEMKYLTLIFTQYSGGFGLVVAIITIFQWKFTKDPRDITISQRFLHILSEAKIKANL